MKTKTSRIQLTIIAFSLMIMFGFVKNFRGVLIPAIKNDFAVSYSKIGLMIFISSIGFMLTTFLGGIAGDKYGLKIVLSSGFSLIIISIIGFNYINSFILLLILMFVLSLGFGTIEIGGNSLGAYLFTENSAVMMNLLHLFFGIGASLGPRFSGWLLSLNFSWDTIYLYSLILVGIIFIFLLLSPFPEKTEDQKNQNIPVKKLIKSKKIWLFVGLLGGALITELGIANWLVNFLQVIRNMSESSSSFYLSLFFITFTLGRLVGGYIAEKFGYLKTFALFTIINILLLTGGLTLGTQGAILFSLGGFFVSIMFPITITIIMKEFEQGLGSIIGFIITAANAVNMVCNWLIGKLNDIWGVYPGFASIILFSSIILIFLFLIDKNTDFNKTKQKTA
ncbi:MAG: MFS transporter [Halanaerobiales bacterium]